MNKKITIGSRGSKLALVYAQNAKDKIIQNTNLNDEDITIKEITTKGDQVQDVRLSEIGGKGLFSTNIEKELKDARFFFDNELIDYDIIMAVPLYLDGLLKADISFLFKVFCMDSFISGYSSSVTFIILVKNL